jgi:hypothetical protein
VATLAVVDSAGATATSNAITIVVSPGTAQIEVTGFTISPEYYGSDGGYLTSSYTCPAGCPFSLGGGQSFEINLTLTNTDTTSQYDHYVFDISGLSGGFSVLSINPSLNPPAPIPPGGSQTFTLTIQAPSVAGSYNVNVPVRTN